MTDNVDTEASRHVPIALQRQLLIEASHRCALPRCQSTSVLEFAHIDPWAEVHEHTFENMIVLCAMCHGLFDREKKIDRVSMRNYKRNLGVLNARYSDLERRVLRRLHERQPAPVRVAFFPGIEIFVQNLIADDLVTVSQAPVMTTFEDYVRTTGADDYQLTPAGRQVVSRWFDGEGGID